MFKFKQFTGLLLIVMLVATFTMQLETKADAATPSIEATIVYSTSSIAWCDANRAACYNYNPALYCVVRWNKDGGCQTWCDTDEQTCWDTNPALYCVVRYPGDSRDSDCEAWCNANRTACYACNPALYCVVRTNDPGCP